MTAIPTPQTLIDTGRALLAEDHAPADILNALYGLEMPREMVALHREFLASEPEHALSFDWEYVPWELMQQSEAQGPSAAERARAETLHQHWPKLILLGLLRYEGTPHGNSFVAYDLDELRAGRTTIFATPRGADLAAPFTPIGPSLLAVLRDALAAYTPVLEQWRDHGPTVIDDDDIAAHQETLAVIDRLLAS